jgi:hypothetical protein
MLYAWLPILAQGLIKNSGFPKTTLLISVIKKAYFPVLYIIMVDQLLELSQPDPFGKSQLNLFHLKTNLFNNTTVVEAARAGECLSAVTLSLLAPHDHNLQLYKLIR